MAKTFSVYGKGRYVSTFVIYHDDALAWHSDVLGGWKSVRWFERPQEIAESGVDEYWAIYVEFAMLKINKIISRGIMNSIYQYN